MPPRLRRRVRIRRRPVSLACLLDLRPEPVGAGGHVHMLDAEWGQRIADRVDDGCARRDRSPPPATFPAELVGRAGGYGVFGDQVRDLSFWGDAGTGAG